jgi:hypothetical protein
MATTETGYSSLRSQPGPGALDFAGLGLETGGGVGAAALLMPGSARTCGNSPQKVIGPIDQGRIIKETCHP